MLRVLVVGQTPPPHGGQAIMIQKLLASRFERVRLHHVRMSFSDEMDEVGRFRLAKLWRLVLLITRIVAARLRYGTQVLYYPPAGPHRVPAYRDAVVLLATRRLFRHTVFHFHAAGLSELLPRLRAPERWLLRRAFCGADCAIVLSAHNPPDGARLGARATYVIPNGLEDARALEPRAPRPAGAPPLILFAGVLCESKGVLVLLEAARRLRDEKLDFRLELMGRFASAELEARVRGFLGRHGLAERVELPGVRTGADKWRAFARADVFAFPSHFESESFGLAVLEAMQFGLPVVATRWRGLPDLVRQDESGVLVPVEDPAALAVALGALLRHPERRRRLGEGGRRLFEAEFGIEPWRQRMEAALLAVAEPELARGSRGAADAAVLRAFEPGRPEGAR